MNSSASRVSSSPSFVVLVHAVAALAAMRALPHGHAPLRALVPGALLIAVGTQVIHLFIVLYLAPRFGRSSQLYGTLGAATTILLWLYVTARLFRSSAYLNATLWSPTAEATPSPRLESAAGGSPQVS